ncbi:ABC transporter substrate-binding protein [Bradyrhizobium sp. CCBAU 11386]|uniref:ABC transporter substrate-binding protein n=1 Tax=Bradyrhizobium sp. CCBAU 11386 TaxID=1630837 RepID=UPI0023020443|nr:ABC transporter substrate-binding protein [Bradyrhizobium sp. CCBAU 11386]
MVAFEKGLSKLGWSGGRNIRTDYQWYQGQTERARTAAAELLKLSPDVMFANANPAVRVLQELTRDVPVVFTTVTDPVGSGFVESLAGPGGNITGFANQPVEGAKFVDLLMQIAPGVKRVSVMVGNSSSSDAISLSAEKAASKFPVETTKVVVRDASIIEPALTALGNAPNSGLIVPGDTVTSSNRQLIVQLAAAHRIPSVYGFKFFAAAGGLLSYGIDVTGQFLDATSYIDRILRGEKPADLPVQQPTKFSLVINVKTAKTLGLTVPPTLLAAADEVIE